MKRFFLSILFISSAILSYSQVETRYYQKGDSVSPIMDLLRLNQNVNTKRMPAFDLEKMKKEDAEMDGLDVPYRFGKGFDVCYTLSDGNWQNIDGGRLWTLSFESEGALSLNFIFENMYLPEGASLYIANQDRTVVYGPVTSEMMVPKESTFLTDIIPGANATIYLFEPFSKINESELTIIRVVHGYRGFDAYMAERSQGDASDCNIDVACFPSYDKESYGVALVLLSDGTDLCSGALLMSTDFSFDPYFLTAFHCIDRPNSNDVLSDSEIEAAENWMFKFRFMKTNCYSSSLLTSYTYNKADFCSAWRNTDFALMKLKSPVSQNSDLTWLGWDRNSNTPSSGVGIHHPQGDVMKISIEENPFGTFSSYFSSYAWVVDFDSGIVEGGSSGSPILNQSKRVVGQLAAADYYFDPCYRTNAHYGKLYKSWTGGGHDDDRLSNWLDPIGIGLTTFDSYHPIYISGPYCLSMSSTAIFEVNNLPSQYTINWYFSNGNGNPAPSIQSSGHSCTVTNNLNMMYSGYLFADIYYSGTLLRTLSQHVDAYAGFYGVYSSGNVTNQQFYPLTPIWVTKGDPIYLQSPNLVYKNVSYSVTTPSTWTYYNFSGELYLSYPNVSSNNPIYITIQNDPNHPCCDNSYQIVIMPNSVFSNLTLNIAMNDDEQIAVSLVKGDCSDDIKSIFDEYADITKSAVWTLEIYNATSSKKVFSKVISGDSYNVNTTGWASGVYIVKATYGNQVLNEKLIIK